MGALLDYKIKEKEKCSETILKRISKKEKFRNKKKIKEVKISEFLQNF